MLAVTALVALAIIGFIVFAHSWLKPKSEVANQIVDLVPTAPPPPGEAAPKKNRKWLGGVNIFFGLMFTWILAVAPLNHRNDTKNVIVLLGVLLVFDAFAFFGKKGFAALAIVLVAWYWLGWAVDHGYIVLTDKPALLYNLHPAPDAHYATPVAIPSSQKEEKVLITEQPPQLVLEHDHADVLTPPVCIKKVEPNYSVNRSFSGDVKVNLIVDDWGRPTDITIPESAGAVLDQEIIRAVSQWEFKPGTKNGQAVPTPAKITVSFRHY